MSNSNELVSCGKQFDNEGRKNGDWRYVMTETGKDRGFNPPQGPPRRFEAQCGDNDPKWYNEGNFVGAQLMCPDCYAKHKGDETGESEVIRRARAIVGGGAQ